MNLLRALPVRTKLPLIIVGLCLATGILMQVVTIVQIAADSRSRVQEEFQGLAAARRDALAKEVLDTEVNLTLVADTSEVASALGAFSSAYRLIEDPTAVLHRAYIDTNPNPVGQRDILDKGNGPEIYHMQHASFHPAMRKMLKMLGLYDIFLFDAEFNNIYTEAKEADFAASFASGPLAESGLGRALRRAEQTEAGRVVFSDFEPYAPSQGIHAAFVVTRVVAKDGITLGYVAFQLNTGALAEIMDDRSGLGETGTAYLVGMSGGDGVTSDFLLGTGVANQTGVDANAVIGSLDRAKVTPQIAAVRAGQDGFFADVVVSGGETGFAYAMILDHDAIRWGVIVERDAEEVFAALDALLIKIALIGLVVAAVVTAIAYFFARGITGPIGRISTALDSIANGDLNITIADAGRADELGVMAQSATGLLDKLMVAKLAEEERERLAVDLRHVVESLSAGLQDLAMGDLSHPITQAFPSEYDALRTDFNSTLDRLAETISQVVVASHSIRARSTDLRTASEDLSRRTENQAAALEETAAALDELTISVKSASDGAREVEGIVRQARKSAEESGVVVQGAVAAMAEIEKSSEQISQIIGAIDDIAFQTNLLALNAGVEAARAGDAGKGFAVVASEVRALAQRSSAAAKEIKALIATSAQHVGRGVDQVGKAGVALQTIVGSVANISTLVSTIATGATEQSAGLAEINIGVTQLDQVTQQNAAMVEGSIAASHALQQDASGLADMVSRFKMALAGRKASSEFGSEVAPEFAPEFAPEIALSQFVPLGFEGAGSKVPGAEALARTAAAGGKAAWQDF